MAKVIDVPNYGQVEFPDSMSDADIVKAIKKTSMDYKKTDTQKQAAQMALEDMSPVEKFFAGMGKRASDIFTLGMRNTPESDKYLMETGPAVAGEIGADLMSLIGGGSVLRGLGQVANLPKVATAGRALIAPKNAIEAGTAGGIYSAATTNGDMAERTKAGAIGTLAGAAVPATMALAQGARSLVEPLTKKGQEAIAGRVLRQASGDKPDDVIRSLQNPEVFVRGSIPTAAEASGNSGIAKLQHGLSTVDQGGFGNNLTARGMDNRAARIAALQGIAGDDAAMAAALQARESATNSLYDSAKQAIVSGDGQFDSLLQRPLIQDGARFAKEIAGNEGRVFSLTPATAAKDVATGVLDSSGNPILKKIAAVPATYSGRTLHDLKLGIDKAFTTDASTGAARRAGASEVKAKAEFLGWLESKISDYGMARKEYERLSKPINQMMIGQELLNKLRPALADYGANTRETAATFARALRDADATAANATGFAKSKMADVMTKDQMGVIEGVAKDLARKASADDMVRGVGSNTAQNLATQNVLRRSFGPLGMPESWAESAMLQTFFKPLNLIYSGVGEKRIADALGKGLLDPQTAARLMTQQQPSKAWGLLNYTPPAVISIAPQLVQQ